MHANLSGRCTGAQPGRGDRPGGGIRFLLAPIAPIVPIARIAPIAPIVMVLFLLLVPATLAWADIIYLSTGGIVKGTIVSETDEILTVRLDSGVETEVQRSEIERIERGESPEEVYRKRLREIDPDDPDAHYELGKWLDRIGLAALAEEEYNKAVILNPNHQDARIALGYVKRGTHWIPKERRQAGDEESPDIRSSGDEESPDIRSTPGTVSLRSIPEATRRIVRKIALADPEERAQGWKAIADLDGPAREAAVAYVARTAQVGVRDLQRNYRKLASAIPELGTEKWAKIKDTWTGRWVAARDAALAVIFDLEIYPDENHGRVGQPVVDLKVVAVREAWRYVDLLIERDTGQIAKMSAEQAEKHLVEMRAAEDHVTDLVTFLDGEDQPLPDSPSPLPLVVRALLTYRAGHIEDAWKMAEKLPAWEKMLLGRLRRIRVREYNTGLVGRATPVGVAPTAAERKQVEITNDYRDMMGRLPLEIHAALVACARGHSEEMTSLGYFEHESPVPDNKTPTKRAARAGYPHGVAENISLGRPDPMETHLGWYNSAPHHRNILGPGHQAMASGQNGEHWTQNYGSVGVLTR